jgi:hypothetical protein
VRPGAFESEPAPVQLGAAAADHRAAAAYSKTKIKVLTKSEVKRAPKKADDETESLPISKSAEVATPPQWIQNPLAQSAAAARRRRFLAEMACRRRRSGALPSSVSRADQTVLTEAW